MDTVHMIRVLCSVICAVFLLHEARYALHTDCPYVGKRFMLGAIGWLVAATA